MINIKEKDLRRIGDVIYPIENGTIVWYKRTRWDVIMILDKKGYPIEVSCLYDYDVVRAVEILVELSRRGVLK